jgi:hypothetical protein
MARNFHVSSRKSTIWAVKIGVLFLVGTASAAHFGERVTGKTLHVVSSGADMGGNKAERTDNYVAKQSLEGGGARCQVSGPTHPTHPLYSQHQ